MITTGRKLGKLAPRLDARTLRFALYQAGASSPPPARDWSTALPLDLGMYANDRIGTCGVASAAHMIQCWTSQYGDAARPLTVEVLDAYAAISGYDGTPASDRGVDMLRALAYWRKIGIAGVKIRGFVKLDHDDVDQLKLAANLFGGLYVGASLPKSAADTAGTWDVETIGRQTGDNAIGSWGGHAMALAGYDRTGVRLVTWGRRQIATWEWFLTYVDEAYAVLDETWIGAGVSPHGFDLAQLDRDLAAIGAAS